MMTISNTLIHRAKTALSNLVLSCPDSAENRKYGRINSNAPKFSIWLAGRKLFLPKP